MYHEKYLKYKYKYLNFKQQTILQYGGDLPSQRKYIKVY